MSEISRDSLRRLLADRYDELCLRLARRVGSKELARETLHETWLHLDQKAELGRVDNLIGYLLRIALNIASDRGSRERRRASAGEIGALLDVADDAPHPDREVEARSEVAALERAIEELSPRRRTILLASRVQQLPLRRIAERLGVSQRLVEIELKHALAHCAERLGRTVTQRFGPSPAKPSLDRGLDGDMAGHRDQVPQPPGQPTEENDPV